MRCLRPIIRFYLFYETNFNEIWWKTGVLTVSEETCLWAQPYWISQVSISFWIESRLSVCTKWFFRGKKFEIKCEIRWVIFKPHFFYRNFVLMSTYLLFSFAFSCTLQNPQKQAKEPIIKSSELISDKLVLVQTNLLKLALQSQSKCVRYWLTWCFPIS